MLRLNLQKCTGRDSNPHAFRRRNLKNSGTWQGTTHREFAPVLGDTSEPGGTLPPPGAATLGGVAG